jgi:hypothetical protein
LSIVGTTIQDHRPKGGNPKSFDSSGQDCQSKVDAPTDRNLEIGV